MKRNFNKYGFISIEAVLVGAMIIVGSILMMNSFKGGTKQVSDKGVSEIKNDKANDESSEMRNSVKKNYDIKNYDDMTEAEQRNYSLVNPDTKEYIGLDQYQENSDNSKKDLE